MQFSSVLITRLQLTIVLSLFFFWGGGGGGCPIATNPDYFQPWFHIQGCLFNGSWFVVFPIYNAVSLSIVLFIPF